MEDTTKSNESPAWHTDEFRIYEYKVRVEPGQRSGTLKKHFRV
jgi:hypothetical protein